MKKSSRIKIYELAELSHAKGLAMFSSVCDREDLYLVRQQLSRMGWRMEIAVRGERPMVHFEAIRKEGV